MIRNLKVLGLALVAVFALSAMVASAASANKIVKTPYWFATGPDASDWTVLSGSQGTPGDEFETDAALPVKCTSTTYSGTNGNTTTTTITVTPAYSGCTFGSFPAEVLTNGCTYVFHTDEKTGTETTDVNHTIDWENKYDTTTTIECPAGKDITVVAKQTGIVKCTVHIPAQNLGTGVTLTNETTAGGKKDIKAHISFNNIAYTETAGSGTGKCAATSGTANGRYSGSATISGATTGGAAKDIWMEPYTE